MALDFWSHPTTFETSSDENFAQLLFKYEFTATALDAVLELLHDPSFRVSELTFRCSADLYDRIANCGRKIAEDRYYDRSRTTTQLAIHPVQRTETSSSLRSDDSTGDGPKIGEVLSQKKSGVSLVVIERVVDFLSEHLDKAFSIVLENNDWIERLYASANFETLTSMCLVHRTWTPIAQRALRRRAFVSEDDILLFLLNPLCGDWLTELEYTFCRSYTRASPTTASNDGHFPALVKRIPNLRRLRLNAAHEDRPQSTLDLNAAGVCVEALVGTPSLRILHLNSCYARAVPYLDAFIKILPFLTCLVELRIDDWVSGSTEVTLQDEAFSDILTISNLTTSPSDNLADYSPPPSLKIIHLYYCALRAPFLSPGMGKWLFEPRGDYRLRELKIVLTRGPSRVCDGNKCITPVISHALPTLESLHVSAIDIARPEGFAEGIFTQCSDTHLRKLSVQQASFLPPHTAARIPRGIETFEFLDVDGQKSVQEFLLLLGGNVKALTRLSLVRCIGLRDIASEDACQAITKRYGFKLECL